jgi:hypothetical protein
MSAVSWVEFFVEERSMQAALEVLIPKIRNDFGYQMLKKLPDRLRGVATYIQSDYRVVVVRDEDRKDCKKLKAQIEGIARSAGLIPKGKKNGAVTARGTDA